MNLNDFYLYFSDGKSNWIFIRIRNHKPKTKVKRLHTYLINLRKSRIEWM